MNRKQFVPYNGVTHLHSMFNTEYPKVQTWVLCFFTILINYLCDCMYSSKALFLADDLKIFKHRRKNSDAADLQK